jgi:Holliday junction DNA helicase RuvA
MIGRIAGILLEKNPPHLLVDCNGVGYEIDVPMSTFYNLPQTGERVVLLTQQIVREDAHLLYGFLTPQERTTFRELLKITGIGARMALAVLSGMSVQELAQAVTMQDAARLTRLPGIGKKTAERLLLELKGKLGADLGALAGAASPSDHAADILNALSRSAIPKRKPRGDQERAGRHRRVRRHQARAQGAVEGVTAGLSGCRPAAEPVLRRRRRAPVGRSADSGARRRAVQCPHD